MAKNIRRAPRGFTLIELVVVVAVIAILAALLVPTILGQAERARVTRARADVNEIGKAAARMRADTDSINEDCYTIAALREPEPPTTGKANVDCGLTSGTLPHCVGTGSAPGELCWGGPYLPRGSGGATSYNDPWNNPYQIKYDSNQGSLGRQGNIVVWSYGLNKTNEGASNTEFDCAYTEVETAGSDGGGSTPASDDICAVF